MDEAVAKRQQPARAEVVEGDDEGERDEEGEEDGEEQTLMRSMTPKRD
jgi:hypothetical protein